MTHGSNAVDPVCEVTKVLFSVANCFSCVPYTRSSRGGKVTVSSFSSGRIVDDCDEGGGDGPVKKRI